MRLAPASCRHALSCFWLTHATLHCPAPLVQRLRDSGARMYGAFWCSHCYDQKQTFGAEAMAAFPYVECYPEGLHEVSSSRGEGQPGVRKGSHSLAAQHCCTLAVPVVRICEQHYPIDGRSQGACSAWIRMAVLARPLAPQCVLLTHPASAPQPPTPAGH